MLPVQFKPDVQQQHFRCQQEVQIWRETLFSSKNVILTFNLTDLFDRISKKVINYEFAFEYLRTPKVCVCE